MKKYIPQIMFLTTLTLVALGAAAYMMYAIVFSSDVYAEDRIEGNFGSAYGIHEITETANESLPGLPATTVKFKFTTNGSDPGAGIAFIGKFLDEQAKKGSTEIVNLEGVSDDGESSKPQTFVFYASSPQDYTDGTFDKALNDFRGLIEETENKYNTVSYTSTPTTTGQRSVDLKADFGSAESGKADELNGAWTSLVGVAGTFKRDGSTYNLTLTTPGDVNTITIDGVFYDEDTYKVLQTLQPRIFSTLTAYKSGNLGLKNIRFTPDTRAGSNNSEFLLTIAGDQPDTAVVNDWVKQFTTNFYYKKTEVLLPSVFVTIIKYENSKEAVYISYPTNEDWE